MKQTRCPNCDAKPGKLHAADCDVERCPECGGQKVSCDCERKKSDRLPWTGLWPGTQECIEFGFFCKQGPGKKGALLSWSPCSPEDPDAQPDLNRLRQATVWSKKLKKYILKPSWN